jgi:hypothetical protein
VTFCTGISPGREKSKQTLDWVLRSAFEFPRGFEKRIESSDQFVYGRIRETIEITDAVDFNSLSLQQLTFLMLLTLGFRWQKLSCSKRHPAMVKLAGGHIMRTLWNYWWRDLSRMKRKLTTDLPGCGEAIEVTCCDPMIFDRLYFIHTK